MSDSIEMLTIFDNKGNEITYIASEFEELGENATPYRIRQNPSENVPFVKFKLSESSGFRKHEELTLDGLKKLVEEPKP